MLGLVFVLVAVGAGLAVSRGLHLCGERLGLAPALGLSALPVLCFWLIWLGQPAWLGGAVLVVLALAGAVVGARVLRPGPDGTTALLAGAALVPTLLLGVAFAGVEVPPSSHDGAFHVETIDAIRRGLPLATWYPIGFHGSLGALLVLLPWLDTARGTLELAQGLTILAPLVVFGLGVALRLRPVVAAAAAAIAAVTFIFPYDYQLWGGWPLGMGVLLALGVWSAALWWLREPRLNVAVVLGLMVGAMVLTHGTEVYTTLAGLLLIAVVEARHIAWRRLPSHAGVALVLAAAIALPYLPTLLGWAGRGGATAVGLEILDYTAANPDMMGRADWLQYALGITGAGSLVDVLLRAGLLGFALLRRPPRALVSLWVGFAVLLFALDFVSLPGFDRLFVLTYPWLVDHRPRQVAVLLASLLEAHGLLIALGYVGVLRARWADRPWRARRVAVACALVLGFFAEGSAVGIYKRLGVGVIEQNLYSSDDSAAMAWLRAHVGPGEVLANNHTADAGIWAPYKANVPILLTRSGAPDAASRQDIVQNVQDLAALPLAEAKACALRVNYLYQGAIDSPYDARLLPPRADLERAQELEEVFRSGQAVVFRIRLPCLHP